MREHRNKLRKGTHHCRALQRAWDKYGEDAFAFEVVERCEAPDLMAREQVWIDREGDYNSAPSTTSTLGMKWTAEAKARASEAQRKRFKDQAQREHLSRLLKGRFKHDAATREKIAAAQRGRTRDPEIGRRISAAKKGIPISAEQRAAISRTMKAKGPEALLRVRPTGPKSDATRARMSASAKGRPKSEAHKASMRAAWDRRRAEAPNP